MSILRVFISLFLVSLFFTGCAEKMKVETTKEYNKSVVEAVQKQKTMESIRNKIKEVNKDKQKLNLSTGMMLSDALFELSTIEERTYFLASSDIQIPAVQSSAFFKINSFKALDEYLQDTTNYKLIVVKNKFAKNRVKIVKAVDRKAEKSDLSNYKISIETGMNVGKALQAVAKKTKFNIVYKNSDIDKTMNQAEDKLDIKRVTWFDYKNVYFYGDNVSDFLSYLSSSLNLFIDVDYEQKLIVISKYKTKFFKLAVNNVTINGSVNENEAGTGAEETQTKDALERKYELNIFDQLEEKLKDVMGVLQVSNEVSSEFLTLNRVNGDIIVKTNLEKMQSIEKAIVEFNKNFSIQAEVLLTTYEIILNRKQNFGVDVNLNFTGSKFSSSLLTALEAADVFKLKYDDGTSTHSADVNSDNQYGKVVKVSNHQFLLRNHIPYVRNSIVNGKYVSKQDTQSSTGDNPIITTSQEIDNTTDGYSLVMLPFIKGDAMSLNINTKFFATLETNEQSVDANSKITLPVENADDMNNEVMIRKGERRIITSSRVYEEADKYQGVFPLDDFIIGGKTDDEYVEKEIVLVLEYIK